MLNIALPCLMFSRIVPAFTSDNISALGPLVLVAFVYEGLGFIMAWVIKQFFWVPHQFRYGILVAGTFGNVGDIPTSVIMSITGVAPFNGSADQTLSVAYISAFILVFFVTLFPAGGTRLIAKDFVGPDIEPEEVREKMREKRRWMLTSWISLLRKIASISGFTRSSSEKCEDLEDTGDEKTIKPVDNSVCGESPSARHRSPTSTSKHVSFYQDDGTTVAPLPSEPNFASRVTSPTATITHIDGPSAPTPLPIDGNDSPILASESVVSRAPHPHTTRHKLLAELRIFVTSLITPASLSIILAFPIALVTPLKALFIAVPNSPLPNAPDGQPPLAFIMDTASFAAGASVPLGLVCLGSALARLKVPRGNWTSIPKGAIVSLAVGRMIVMPVIGVLIVQGLVHVDVISKDDKVLQFVCIFLSCLPTATTQVFLTQIFSGTGAAEHLAPFLIPQYIIMFVTMTALTAYTLQTLF